MEPEVLVVVANLTTVRDYYHLRFHPDRDASWPACRRRSRTTRPISWGDPPVRPAGEPRDPRAPRGAGDDPSGLSAGCSSGEEPTRSRSRCTTPAWRSQDRVDACDLNADRVTRGAGARLSREAPLRSCDADARRKCRFSRAAPSDCERCTGRAYAASRPTSWRRTARSAGRRMTRSCAAPSLYVSDQAFASVIGLFTRSLLPGGYLFLGHSESLLDRKTTFAPRDGRGGGGAATGSWRPRDAGISGGRLGASCGGR